MIPDLPCYVRNKFQCGFPEDWKEVKLMWEKYIKQGEFTCIQKFLDWLPAVRTANSTVLYH
jgi:hypothetical protein